MTTYDAKGAVARKYLAAFWDGDPRAYALSQTSSAPYGRQRYDAFGRQLQTLAWTDRITLQSTYHALSVDKADAADLLPAPIRGRRPARGRTGTGARSR